MRYFKFAIDFGKVMPLMLLFIVTFFILLFLLLILKIYITMVPTPITGSSHGAEQHLSHQKVKHKRYPPLPSLVAFPPHTTDTDQTKATNKTIGMQAKRHTIPP